MTDPACIFCKILAKQLPSAPVYEDASAYAFLDIGPFEKGHTLVIPKQEVDYIFDVEDELLKGLVVFAKKVAKAIGKAFPCKKVGIMVAGIEVPHAHVHLIPINSVGDLSSSRAKAATQEELAAAAAKIRANLK